MINQTCSGISNLKQIAIVKLAEEMMTYTSGTTGCHTALITGRDLAEQSFFVPTNAAT